jgi:hypothetical protein
LSPPQIDAVRAALPGEVRDWLEDGELASRPLAALTPDEHGEVHDASWSALMNAAPIVRSYTARESAVTYPIWIAGIDGVYLLMAPEHETLGPFTTLADAVDAMDLNYGKFLVGE